MIFSLSRGGSYTFHIPDDWLKEADAYGWKTESKVYTGTALPRIWPGVPVSTVSMEEIALPLRTRVGGPFDRTRMVSILRGLRLGESLPALEVDAPPPGVCGCRFRLIAGYHRYHACEALGFTHVAAVVGPYDPDLPWSSQPLRNDA